MRNNRHLMKTWNFERKMSFLLTLALVGTSIIILIASTLSAVFYMTKQTRQLAFDQIITLASNYDDCLKQYQTHAVALVMNPKVQSFCKSTDKEAEYEKKVSDVYGLLLNSLNMQNNLNFVVVMKEDAKEYVYKGNSSVVDARFEFMYEKDYQESIPAKNNSMVKLSFNNNYFRGGVYTLTLYHPIYLTTEINNECGMLVMNLNDNLLHQLYYRNQLSFDTSMFLMDVNGKMVSISDSSKIEETVPYIEHIQGERGSFRYKGKFINYQKVGAWSYYIVNEIPILELFQGSINMMFILLLIIVLMTVISIIVMRRMIKKYYKPINKVVSVMDNVSEGRLDIRLNVEHMDIDSQKLANGFNTMMDEINLLMERVKLEQHQMEQIRFNALQAQIKPHFLYNTLECIHWEALATGNQTISTMVKALANYYRICLSKGKEVISLKTELEHIHSYIIIQNMRYDNIVEIEEIIDLKYMDVQIPKMTLQPLIENAIYHGIKVKEGKRGKITISVKENIHNISLEIADSGTGMSIQEIEEMNHSISQYDESFGYGVRNVNRRIQLLFGSQYGLNFRKNEKGGLTVEICLPLKD